MTYPKVDLKTALTTAAIFVDGDWVESKDQDPNGNVRLIQLADVGSGEYLNKSSRFLTSTKASELGCTFLEAGDLLVARMPEPIGRTCIFPGDVKKSVTVVDVCIIRPDIDTVDPSWLMHCLNTPDVRRQVTQLSTGTTRSRVSRTNLGRIEIPFPKIEEQRRIAQVLDSMDALRAKRRKAIVLLDDLAQSIFFDMFGSYSDGTVETWPVRSVEDVCVLVVDCVNRTALTVDYETPYKMIRTTNVKLGKIDLSVVRYVDRETFLKWNRRATPRKGDVILTREAPVGEVGILNSDDHVFLGQRLMLYRANATKMTGEYLLAVFRSPYLRRQFDRHGSGSTVKHLPLPACRSFEIPTPPLALQAEFERRIRNIRSLKAAHQAHLAELDSLFSSLQDRAFRGELWDAPLPNALSALPVARNGHDRE